MSMPTGPCFPFSHAAVQQLAENRLKQVARWCAWLLLALICFRPSLAISGTAPFFLLEPARKTVLQHATANLTASAGGTTPLRYQWRFNGTNLPGATYSTLAVTNAQPVHEGNYSVVVTNLYGTVISSNAFLSVIDLPEALGPTNLVWLNPSQPAWFPQWETTHDGVAAAAAGPLTNFGKLAVLQTAVTGPGKLSFWWTDSAYVPLSFYVDGKLLASRQQNNIWVWDNPTFYLPAGVHGLTWTAGSQNSSHNGFGYLDQVTFVPGTTPVSITSQPASQTNRAGADVTFTIWTAGTPPMTFQWLFNGLSIPGATGSSLTVSNVQAAQAGSYSVSAANDYGTVTSSKVLLTVLPAAPTITLQPMGVPVSLGGQVTLRAAATGTSPIAYQWLRNGQPIPGATAPSITFNSAQYSDQGNYSLLASNLLGTALSSNAFLSPYSVPDLAATLDNSGVVWSTTNVPWFPQTNTTHDGVSAAQSGAISNAQQSTLQGIVAGPATVTYWWKVNCNSFWVNLAFVLNGTVQNAIGGTVDWRQETNYLGAGSQTLQWNLYPVQGAFAGGTGWVDQVQIIPGGTAPTVITNPVSATTSAGNSVQFSLSGAGTPPLRYQWQFNGSDLPGATNATLALSNVQTNHAGVYSAVVMNDLGSAASSNLTLTVTPSAPVITAKSASQSRIIHGSTAFSVMARGSSPLAYQWRFNGSAIPGATLSTLSLTNLQAAHAGNYTVVVTNAFGAVTSSVVALEVTPTLVIDYWPVFTTGYPLPFGLSNLIAIAAGNGHTVALRNNGTVASWGQNNYGVTNVPAGLSNVIAIAAGANHTAALKADGTIVTWGDNTYAQVYVPAAVSNVTAIAAAANHTFALRNDGTVVGWGHNGSKQLNLPAGLSDVQRIAAGPYNGFAVKADGTVVQWGDGPVWQHNGTNEQLTVALGMSNVTAIAAGGSSAWSRHADGTVSGWGMEADTQYRYSDTATLAAANSTTSSRDYVLALRYDGTVFKAGLASYFDSPYILPSPSNVISIAAAPNHGAVLVNDGTPAVVGRLLSQTVYGGSTAVFSAQVVGAPPLTYQWQFNGANLESATNALLVISNVPLAAAGKYRCLVSNRYGAATNSDASLTVLRSAPWFNSSAASFSPGTFSLQLDQLSGHGTVLILASTNLVDWVPVFTNPPHAGSLQFFDSSASNNSSRFYRAVEY